MLQTPVRPLGALTYAIIAYLVGSLQDSVLRAAWWIPVVTATAASLVGVILYGVFGTVLGEDLVGWELLRVAVIVASSTPRSARRPAGHAVGHRLGEQRSSPGGVPVIAESPRIRMSVLGIVVFALFASLFARLYYLQVMVTDQYQVAAQANRIRVVPVEAPRGRILDRNGKVLVDNRLSVQLTIDRTVLNKLEDDEAHGGAHPLADGLARPPPASPRPSTRSKRSWRTSATAPTCRSCRRRRAGGAEDLDRRAQRRAPWRGGRAGAVRRYPYGQLAAHVLGYTGQIIDEEFEAKAGSAKPYTLRTTRSGSTASRSVYEDHLRGARLVRSIEVDAENQPIRVRSAQPIPIPGDDVVPQPRHRVQSTGRGMRCKPGSAAKARLRAPRSARTAAPTGPPVSLDPKTARVLAHGVVPHRSTRRTSSTASADTAGPGAHRAGNKFPLNNWAIQGQYAPARPSSRSAPTPGLKLGLITPNDRYLDDGYYEVPTAVARAASSTTRPVGPRRGRPPRGAHRLERLLLLRPRVPHSGWRSDQLRRPEGAAGPPAAVRVRRQDTGIDLPSEQSGSHPHSGLAAGVRSRPSTTDTPRLPVGGSAGDNMNIAIGQGDVLVTPLQLADAYATVRQRRHAVPPASC